MKTDKKVKKIAFDVDGVLADFPAHYCRYYNMLHEDDQITPEDLTDYSLKNLKYPEKLWEIPGFFITLPVMAKAREVFNDIIKKYNVIIITACPEFAIKERLKWFEIFFPEFDRSKIYFAADKTQKEYDILIDDNPANIVAAGDKGVIYTQNYNLDFPGDNPRVSSWNDIAAYLETVS